MNILPTLFQTRPEWTPLVLRVMLGGVIFAHGAQKVLGWFGGHGLEGTLGFFTQKMGLPWVVAVFVIAVEFLGSLGLIAGFLTRFSAGGIAAVMIGAVATVHWGNGFFMNWAGRQPGEGFEFHLLVLGMAAALVLSGGGKYSIDRAIAHSLGRDRSPESVKGMLAVAAH